MSSLSCRKILVMDGPTIITQIDTWVLRNKTQSQSFWNNGDYESVVGYNVVLLYDILARFGVSSECQTIRPLFPPLFSLLKELIESLQNEPTFFYPKQLYNSIKVPHQVDLSEKEIFEKFLKFSLSFQKLRLDQRRNKLGDFYPKVDDRFEYISTEFNRSTSFSLYQDHIDDIRNVELQIFSNWHQPIVSFQVISILLPAILLFLIFFFCNPNLMPFFL